MKEREEVVLIEKLDADEIKVGVKYAHPSRPGLWFELEELKSIDGAEYCINVSGSFSGCIFNGNMVRTWKSPRGAIRFVERSAVDPQRPHYHRFKMFDAPDEMKKYAAKVQEERERRAESEALREELYQQAAVRYAEARAAECRGLEIMRSMGLDACITEQGHRLVVQLGNDKFELSYVECRPGDCK